MYRSKLSTPRTILLAVSLSLCLCHVGLAEKSASEGEARGVTAPAKSKASSTEAKAPGAVKRGEAKVEKKTPEVEAAPTENFIVQASSMDVAFKAVEGVGGKITHRLGIIDAVAADLNKKQIKTLTEVGGLRLHANRRVQVEN